MFEFYNLKLSQGVSSKLRDPSPEEVCIEARKELESPGTGDKVALAAMKWYLTYFAHNLAD